MSEYVELYKERNFGEKINTTFEIIRSNFLPLIKVALAIGIPLGLIYAVITGQMMASFSDFIDTNNPNSGSLENGFAGIMVIYFIVIIVLILGFSLLYASFFAYLREKNTNPDEIVSIGRVFSTALRKLPGIIIISIISGIATLFGSVFFIIPGIYLFVVFSLSSCVLVFEDEGIGNALSAPFKLIKGKWWSTFGVIIVGGFIASGVTMVFAIPSYVMMFTEMFANIESEDFNPASLYRSSTGVSGTFMNAISSIGMFLSYMVPAIALAMQYGNLKERLEGKGLKDQIEEFETIE